MMEPSDLPHGIAQHRPVGETSAVTRHERQPHVKVVGPKRMPMGPRAHERTVRKTGLSVTDMLRGPFDIRRVRLRFGRTPCSQFDHCGALGPAMVQLVEFTQKMIGFVVFALRDAEFPVSRKSAVDLPFDEIGVLGLPETVGHPQHGHIEHPEAVMPVHVLAGETDPRPGGNLVGRSVKPARGTIGVPRPVIGEHLVGHTAQQRLVVRSGAPPGKQQNRGKQADK